MVNKIIELYFGEMILTIYQDCCFISYADGEGMEISKAEFGKLLKRYLQEHF